MMNFGRLLTAMVTPFDEHEELDYTKTSDLIEHLLATGTDGLVVSGTTGESPTLTDDEKIDLFDFVVREVNGRVPVLAGVGSNNTKATIELMKRAEAVGIDGVMLVVPYYNKPSQEGLYQHFSKIASHTTLPIMLYNIPGRTAVNMEPETIIRLSQIENIVSVKESSGDLDAASKIIHETADDFSVYSGDDSMTLPMLSIGGAGVVSVAAHVIGEDMRAMVDYFFNGEVEEAAILHGHIVPVIKSLFQAPSPTPVKAALNHIGVPAGGVRLPLVSVEAEVEQDVIQTLENFNVNKIS
jgi:4-hydroxy-tetrahydrodipicolinate synthase